MPAYDVTDISRALTRAALFLIFKYTDEADYELLFMDTIPPGSKEHSLFDTYNVLQLGEREDRQWIKLYCDKEENPGPYAMYNRGAKLARGDYLCFIHTDILVEDNWLKNLRYYLDGGHCSAVMPDQRNHCREDILYYQQADYLDSRVLNETLREAGLIMMTRKAFEDVGGWPEDIRIYYGEKVMYPRLTGTKNKLICTAKCQIHHVAMVNYKSRVANDYDNLLNDKNISGAAIKEYDEGRRK